MKHQNSNIAILTALLRAENMLTEYNFAYDKQGNVTGLHVIGGLTNFQRKAFNRINQTLANKAQSEIKAEGCAISNSSVLIAGLPNGIGNHAKSSHPHLLVVVGLWFISGSMFSMVLNHQTKYKSKMHLPFGGGAE